MGARCCLHPSGYLSQSCINRSESCSTLAKPLVCCLGLHSFVSEGKGTCESRTTGLQAGGKEGFQNGPDSGVSTGTFSAVLHFCEHQV